MLRPVTARQMQELDRRSRKQYGIPELILMEHAGAAVAHAVRPQFNRLRKSGGSVLVLAGGGANGGDGFVAARHLDNWAIPVRVVLIGNPSKVAGSSLINLKILHRIGVPVTPLGSMREWTRWTRKRPALLLVVDALLGTGISGHVREPIRSAIRWLNRQRLPVISVDLPSGLSSDTGLPCGAAVRATMTVTCGYPKWGLYRGKGPEFSGRTLVADISIPRTLRMEA